jgi:SsrA-binding protein
MARPEKPTLTPLASNRKALHDYEVLERLEGGLQLAGTEVKSARQGRVQLKDSHVELRDGQAFLVGVHISPYSHGNRENQEPERPRRVLLHRREIDRLYGQLREKGLTLVPTKLYFRDGRVKVELALARGKDVRDKRRTIADRDAKRQMERALKTSRR